MLCFFSHFSFLSFKQQQHTTGEKCFWENRKWFKLNLFRNCINRHTLNNAACRFYSRLCQYQHGNTARYTARIKQANNCCWFSNRFYISIQYTAATAELSLKIFETFHSISSTKLVFVCMAREPQPQRIKGFDKSASSSEREFLVALVITIQI